jgi:hypothetical protein
MSTKTTFKRVALVAVAALGFGVLTSVAPATAAANANITAITAGTSDPARVLVSSGGTTITVTHAETTGDVGVDTVTAQITSAPATSVDAALTFSASAESLGGPNGTGTYTASTKTNQLATSNAGVARAVFSPNRLATFTTTALTLKLNADVAGTYTILVTADAASAAGFSAGKLSTTYTITTAGAPTALTASSYAGSVTTSGRYGQLMKLTMKDAAGNATVLGLNEAIDITDNSTAVTQLDGFSAEGSAITSFGSASAHVNGTYFFRVVNTGTAIAADGTAVVTFTGGGLLPSSLTTNASATLVKAVAATTGSTITVAPTTSTTVRGNASGSTAYSSGTMYAPGSVAVTFSVLTNDSTAAAVVIATEASDAAGAVYNSTVSKALTATSTNTTTVAGTVPAVTATGANTTLRLLTVLDGSSGGVTATASFGARAARTVAVLGSASVLSATAGSTTWNVQVKDQYGTAIAFAPISVAVSGRNTVATTALGVTDANGIISYTLADKGTTGTTDTLTFTSGSLTAATATVTYGTVTVAKVSFTGPNTTSGVAAATTTVSPIRANDTPEASTAAASVVVTDASGNLLAGVPVVFTVSGTTAAITSNVVTVYTDSAGKAASTVFAWVAGTYTVTATAGGVTGTGSYTFANTTAADARVLSATVADGIISAKVVDRFGNPVSGVSVYASRTSGTGYFGSGVSKTTTTTGTDGIAEFTLIGNAEVKVSTLDYAAAAGTNAPGQTCALAGNIDCAVGATAAKAFTATTAGTTAVAAKNYGSTFAPAGVSTVSVTVSNSAAADAATAAADAAAEATDAANAATDAANAAAEAADAATAAAQDAADAVAALSTQVSEMVDALKKQITALTNLVIKIQKKVKA